MPLRSPEAVVTTCGGTARPAQGHGTACTPRSGCASVCVSQQGVPVPLTGTAMSSNPTFKNKENPYASPWVAGRGGDTGGGHPAAHTQPSQSPWRQVLQARVRMRKTRVRARRPRSFPGLAQAQVSGLSPHLVDFPSAMHLPSDKTLLKSRPSAVSVFEGDPQIKIGA